LEVIEIAELGIRQQYRAGLTLFGEYQRASGRRA
jgi:hypothetical protein